MESFSVNADAISKVQQIIELKCVQKKVDLQIAVL